MSRFKNNGTETGNVHTVQVVEVAVFSSSGWTKQISSGRRMTEKIASEETVAVDVNGWISTCVEKESLKNQKRYTSQKIKSRSVLTLDSKMSVLIRNSIYPEKPLAL